jgi:sugar phosphate isomerase/epimerase
MSYTLAISSHYADSTVDPRRQLEHIAEAGFTHVLWGHHAWTDYIYTEPEIEHAARCLEETGLRVVDLHCPTGKDQRWGSPVEYQRLAGIEVLKNRLHMARRLACDVIVCHIPGEPDDEAERATYWDRQKRTLDAVRDVALAVGVRVALENTLPGNFDTLERFMALGGPEWLGICYDSGHGNARVDWSGNGLERFARVADRVIDLHLHDNDGTGDHHQLPFTGTTDWQRLSKQIIRSAYGKRIVPLEVGMAFVETDDERAFLRQVADTGRRLAAMLEAAERDLE